MPFYGEVRRDRIGARFDLLWMEFKRVGLSDLNLSPPDLPIDRQSQLGLDMQINLVLFHQALSYRLFETTLDIGPLDYLRIEPLVGFRYVNFAIEAVITDSLVLEEIGMTTLDAKENWWTFVPVGVEVELGFCEKWSLLANVMLGGWGMGTAKGGTDGIADVLLKYRLSENWTAQLGVRWFDMYMKGDDLDLELHNAWGPLIKFAWNF